MNKIKTKIKLKLKIKIEKEQKDKINHYMLKHKIKYKILTKDEIFVCGAPQGAILHDE